MKLCCARMQMEFEYVCGTAFSMRLDEHNIIRLCETRQEHRQRERSRIYLCRSQHHNMMVIHAVELYILEHSFWLNPIK